MPAGWRESAARLATRHPAPATEGRWPGGCWAARCERESRFGDERVLVILDGFIDNLDELDRTPALPDAERIAHLFDRDGDALWARLEGNFSLVLVQTATGVVYLVRDRFGTRPLYYARLAAGWAWASELKSLCPLLPARCLDAEGVRQAIQFRYVLGQTLLQGVSQVMPACVVRLVPGQTADERQYWSLDFTPAGAPASLDEWADRVDAGLGESLLRIGRRHRDVGILLSGGVDSSLLAQKASRAGFRKCVAFTARWQGPNPELESAIAVARHLGIEHRIVDLDDAYIAGSYPWLVWRLEEPPRHYNSFALAMLFQAASREVGTLLSGHAADAMFGPSEAIDMLRFRHVQALLRPCPRRVRQAFARRLPGASMRRVRWRKYLQGDPLDFLTDSFAIDYGRLGPAVFGERLRDRSMSRPAYDHYYDAGEPAPEQYQRLDLYTFLQSHQEMFERCATPFGISVSLPFLAPQIVEEAQRLPTHFKSDRRIAKPVLKKLAARHFPPEWIYREKQGFPTLPARWLDGPLAAWRRIIGEKRTAERGLVNAGPLQAAAAGSSFEAIWTAMSLETACRQLVDGEPGPA